MENVFGLCKQLTSYRNNGCNLQLSGITHIQMKFKMVSATYQSKLQSPHRSLGHLYTASKVKHLREKTVKLSKYEFMIAILEIGYSGDNLQPILIR